MMDALDDGCGDRDGGGDGGGETIICDGGGGSNDSVKCDDGGDRDGVGVKTVAIAMAGS